MSDTPQASLQLRQPGPVHQGSPNSQWTEDYFVYGIGPVTVTAGAQAQSTIQVQADSWFLWERAAYYVTVANAAFSDSTRPVPNVALQITDAGSGRQLFQSEQPIPSLFGTGLLPFVLPQPRYFKPNSVVQIQLTNFDAAVDYIVRLSFIGSKIFRYQP